MSTVANVHRAVVRCCYFVSFSLIIPSTPVQPAPWAMYWNPGLSTDPETEAVTKEGSIGGLLHTRIRLDPLTQEHTFPYHSKGSFFPTHQERVRGAGSKVVTSTDLKAIKQEELTRQGSFAESLGFCNG